MDEVSRIACVGHRSSLASSGRGGEWIIVSASKSTHITHPKFNSNFIVLIIVDVEAERKLPLWTWTKVTLTTRHLNHALAVCINVNQQSGPDGHAAAESSQTDGVRRAWSRWKKAVRVSHGAHRGSAETVDTTPVRGICCLRPRCQRWWMSGFLIQEWTEMSGSPTNAIFADCTLPFQFLWNFHYCVLCDTSFYVWLTWLLHY